jgi:DNA-directed RNA polymerase specialized sigma24 family protein
MAMRDEQMHTRLLEWAQWRKVGDGSGYPTMSVLHEDWSPPSPGQTPTMKVSAPSSARVTHRAMVGWSGRLRNTVALYYLTNLPIAEQAARLECAERTVHERIDQAHGLLRAALSTALLGELCNMQKVG